MEIFNLPALLLSLTALFSYLNYRFLKLPTTIGMMLLALIFSALLILAGTVNSAVLGWAQTQVEAIRFDRTLMHGMLSFLLFAGALHVDLDDFRANWRIIGSLALPGTLLSTLLVSVCSWWMLEIVGLGMPFVYCLLFGSLISPTDPIAVLGILKTVGTPKSLEAKITGESLFNDGVGVVVFLVLLQMLVADACGHGSEFAPKAVLLFFVQEVFGGIIFGLLIGSLAFFLIRSVDDYKVEILLTVALVTGGYALASALHISGPLAIVVAGLLIGNQGRTLAMSETTRRNLDLFWELVDDILNALLFVILGLELIVLTVTGAGVAAGLFAIPIVLLARLGAVGIPVAVLRHFRSFTPGAVRIMVWGGLRGGISVALALSIPPGRERDIILVMTYLVVLFSILVQGLTLKRLVRRTLKM